VLDQRAGPEDVEAEAEPRPIPVYNTTAAEMAQMVQQLYQDRMAGPGAVMSPQEMMKMIRGGNNVDQQLQKMSIAVDARNNLLVVRAPDALFQQVKAMVNYLDQSVNDSPQITKVVSLKNTNSAAVQQALASMLGNVKTTTTPAPGQTTGAPPVQTSTSGSGDDDSPEERMRRAMRRNWEMIQEMRRMQERSGSDGERGGFDRSRYFGRGSDSRRGRGDGERDRGDRGRDGRGD
jgi:hypothetical protein